jgi:UDP-N-acetylmuramoyl-L-alanyl-D-glutamate--2,6-diaminopimelate ligase
LNADDSFSDTLASNIASDVNIIRYSIEVPSADSSAADVWLDNVSYHGKGVSADLHSPWGEFELASPLLGAFNLSNLLAVISCLAALGYPISKLLASCATIHPIDGRMQRVDSIADINVVIDYAHTPDALEKALSAMGQHTQAKLWCVFGCGGDRDQGKRPLMGAIAQRFADHVVVTSDNPRSEEADDIINQILVGVDRPSLVESDRAKAIGFAIANAATGDVILIAGKGHEDYQEVGGQRLPFSDINQARLALAKRLQVGGQ